ncbi:MAG: UvrB/UvrC motif-containing protein [Planctomycetia bacterium]
MRSENYELAASIRDKIRSQVAREGARSHGE